MTIIVGKKIAGRKAPPATILGPGPLILKWGVVTGGGVYTYSLQPELQKELINIANQMRVLDLGGNVDNDDTKRRRSALDAETEKWAANRDKILQKVKTMVDRINRRESINEESDIMKDICETYKKIGVNLSYASFKS